MLQSEFKASLNNLERPCLKKKEKITPGGRRKREGERGQRETAKEKFAHNTRSWAPSSFRAGRTSAVRKQGRGSVGEGLSLPNVTVTPLKHSRTTDKTSVKETTSW